MGWILSLIILTVSAFFMELSFTMITPFLPMYLVKELSVNAANVNFWAGAVFAVTFLVSGLLGPVWGLLADRKSRKLMALRASFFIAISYCLCGLVRTPEQLFLARFFQGLSAGLYPALLALVASSVPNSKIGFSMGLLQGGMTIGGIAGPFIGGALAEQFGMRQSFFIATAAMSIITLLILIFVKEAPHPKSTAKGFHFDWAVLRRPPILRMLVAAAVIYAALYSPQPILPLYLVELQKSMDSIMIVAGTVFSLCGIPVMIASPLLGIAGQKFGFNRVLLICTIASAILITLQVAPSTVAGFAVVRIIGGFAVAGPIPMMNAILSEACPPDKKGEVYGFNFLTGHVGMAIGPLLAGAVAGFIGYGWVIALSGLILLPLAAYLYFGDQGKIDSYRSVKDVIQ